MPSLDLGHALDVAHQAIADAVRTAGTTVNLTRPGPVTAVDPDTTAATAPATSTIASGVAAIVVPSTPGGQQRVYPGAPMAEDPRWLVILPPEITDIRRGDHVTVATSRDARLVARVFEVSVVLDNTAGAARQALARAVPVSGQT